MQSKVYKRDRMIWVSSQVVRFCWGRRWSKNMCILVNYVCTLIIIIYVYIGFVYKSVVVVIFCLNFFCCGDDDDGDEGGDKKERKTSSFIQAVFWT